MSESGVNRKTLPALHTESKLKLYERFLDKYLSILSTISWITRIHVFDLFCGTGLSANGRNGSPQVLMEGIRRLREMVERAGKKPKKSALWINESAPDGIERIKPALSLVGAEGFPVHVHHWPTDALWFQLLNSIRLQDKNQRNLVFIDPLGFSGISRKELEDLLLNGRTELAIFLPVSAMYKATKLEEKEQAENPYRHLLELIEQCLSEPEAAKLAKAPNQRAYTQLLREALSLQQQYFSSSFFIQLDRWNYHALFIITPNLLGLQRINEAQWQMDELRGEGIPATTDQISLFNQPSQHPAYEQKMKQLESLLEEYMRESPKTNPNVYQFILQNGFLPSQAEDILQRWRTKNKLSFWRIREKKPADQTYVGYEYFTIEPIIEFRLKAS